MNKSIFLIITGILLAGIPIITNPIIVFLLDFNPYAKYFFALGIALFLIGIIGARR